MRRLLLAISVSGVLLLATWVQAPAAPARDVVAPSAADVASAEQTAQSVTPVARQIDEEAERLRLRLATQTPFTAPVRDPFRFRATRGTDPFSAGSAEKEPVPVVLRTPVSPAVVVPTLVGVTEDAVAGVVTRTAILSMGDDMAIVKIGQVFSRFVVQSIGATAVELVDVTSPNRAVTTITIR